LNLLAIPLIRERVCRVRYSFLKRFYGIRQGTNEGVLHLAYSQSHFKSYLSFKGRVNYLVEIVNSLLPKKKKNLSILAIGPRFESELFGYRGLGIKWRNIQGLDTFSYSPKIQIGNMHSAPFNSGSFDIIVCGWTIAYSATPEVAFSEFFRLLKREGKVVITWDLPDSFEVKDPSSLTLNRKQDIDDIQTLLPENRILEAISTNFAVYRLELGRLPFNGSTPFATLVLEPLK
jgi:SAM-dependent methyltransferase